MAGGDGDYYRTLGIERGASKAEVKAAFYRLAPLHHPDRHADSDAAARAAAGGRFRRVYDAYTVLQNDATRAAYDHIPRTTTSSATSGKSGGAGAATYGRYGGGGFSRPQPPSMKLPVVLFFSLATASALLVAFSRGKRKAANEGAPMAQGN
uniref:J domain-containing protein n=1 Tax=Oryza punctata TaxID=4537 RepID=A0A0E0JH25_ORYPU